MSDDVLALKFPLMQYSKDGGKSWPIGDARPTKSGSGIQCNIHYGNRVSGPFYIVINEAARRQAIASKASSVEEKIYTLVKYIKKTGKKISIGEASFTDGGENIVCKTYPSYNLKGSFFFFP